MYYSIILIRIQSNLIRLRTSSGIIKNPYPHSYPCNMYSTPYPIKKNMDEDLEKVFLLPHDPLSSLL